MTTGSDETSPECLTLYTHRKRVTSLSGYTDSVIAEDAEHCFTRDESFYRGLRVITVGINGQPNPLHICGTTNTGWNFYGCGHGAFDDGCVPLLPTGEFVIAQGCKIDCVANILDPSRSPIVTVAEIDGQWHIVAVLDASSFSRPPEYPDHCFGDDQCCHAFKDIRATVSGCSDFDGETFILEARNSAYSWEGSIQLNGNTLRIAIVCDRNEGDWNIQVSCNEATAFLGVPPPEFDCGDSSGTGSSSTSVLLEGHLLGCCEDFEISLQVLESSFRARCEYDPNGVYNAAIPTGHKVIAESCGVDLQVGDEIIVVEVEDEGGWGSGTGSGSSGNYQPPDGQKRWHVVRTCDELNNCGDCPPPPPPPSDCCGLTYLNAPEELVGLVTISASSDAACVCPDQMQVLLRLVPLSEPVEWAQDPDDIVYCPTPGNPAGSDDASTFLGIQGLRVTCGGAETGDGSGTHSTPGRFFLRGGGCPSEASVETSSANCDPIFLEFDIDATACCGAYSGPAISLSMHLEFVEA